MMTRARWLLGWGLMAGTYLSLAVVRVVAHSDWGGALVYGGAAIVTFGFASAVIPFVLPRRGGSGEGGEGGGGREPSPPWWPEFEREFWGHVGGETGPNGGAMKGEPTAAVDPENAAVERHRGANVALTPNIGGNAASVMR